MKVTSFASGPQPTANARSEPVRQLPIVAGFKHGEVGGEARRDLTHLPRESKCRRPIHSRRHDALGRAQPFLVSIQLKDGSWAVKGTKENKKDRVEETASYWGAAWATLGLLQTLP